MIAPAWVVFLARTLRQLQGTKVTISTTNNEHIMLYNNAQTICDLKIQATGYATSTPLSLGQTMDIG